MGGGRGGVRVKGWKELEGKGVRDRVREGKERRGEGGGRREGEKEEVRKRGREDITWQRE